ATAETAIARYDFTYRIGQKMLLNAIADYTQTTGRGTDVTKTKREIGSGALLFKHQVVTKIGYELGIRKELTSDYESPMLFSAGLKLQPTKVYALRLNGSRNFRIPTFNDLYWSDGGNPDLKPESSYQAEVGNEFRFPGLTISVVGHYMKISDMIQWLPGTTNAWFPQNVNEVRAYGAEVFLEAKRRFGVHTLTMNGTYAYTVSKNERTGKQLIYVPYHKATGAIAYGYRKFSANVQGLFNGEVFTRTDNNKRYNLDGYAVVNAGLNYDFGKRDSYRVGFQVLNALDSEYFTMERRPYPGRNYNITLTLIL
ncbi:MAG: TonB-dependent receptor, partial [Proteobacteria bacterium]